MKKYIKKLAIFQVLAAIGIASLSAQTPDAPRQTAADRLNDTLFECRVPGFARSNYDRAVSVLFSAFERESGEKIAPASKGRVGLKIYTNSGVGMCTPRALVDAVVSQLEKRGYKRENITLVDMSRRKMRDCGFLPRVSALQNGTPDNYKGSPVADIESGKFFDKNWYYDNSLMPKSMKNINMSSDLYNPELRKSYLPVPLFLTVDFWINLPVITDMEGLGVCAAIGNASIWNMSNNERFLKQPANASMAAAEVSAIPELRSSNLLTILSYERGQFVGGAIFNSRCSFSENTILMSSNPVVIDYLAWNTINKYRRSFGFAPIDPMPPLLNYCKELKIGDYDMRKIRRVNVPYAPAKTKSGK